MILEFKVKNFLSFKEEQTISFEASTDKYLEDYHCILADKDTKVLRMCMIYGANASGKSNLLIALDFLKKICLETKERNEKTGFIPFSFDQKTKYEPGQFEISFFTEGHRYVYSITIDNKLVYEEKLIYYPGAQPALIFHRQYQKSEDDYSLKTGSKIKVSQVELAVLKSNSLNNMSIISGMSKTNIKFQELNVVYNWFNNILNEIIKPSHDLYRETITQILHQPVQFKEFIFNGLEKADFNISDIYIEPENDIIAENRDYKFAEDINLQASYRRKDVYFLHSNKYGDNVFTEKLDIKFQSAGTLKYFGLLGLIKMAIDNHKIINFDELENSLHPELINHLLNTYLYHSKLSSSNSQFIFTTHNIDLLASDFVRKDIVWFSEKQSNGSTNLYSLSDFDIRKNLSFVNAYKAGKFGAFPNLGII